MNVLDIGKNIYRLRKEKAITQEELSKIVGVSVAAVSKWEGGASYPDITLLPLIATFFEVSIDDLLGYYLPIDEELVQDISLECANEFDNSFDGGENLCAKYLKKYTKSYKLKYYLSNIMVMRAMNLSDEEKRIKMSKVLGMFNDVMSNSNDKELIEGSIIQIASIYTVLEEYDKAIEVYEKIESSKMSKAAMLSHVYIKKGEKKKAIKELQQELAYATMNVNLLLGALSEIYLKEDINIAKQYMDLRKNVWNSFEYEDDFTHYSLLLNIAKESKNDIEIVEGIKNILKNIECFDKNINNQIKWYMSELEIKNKQNSVIAKIFNHKKMLKDILVKDEELKKYMELDEIKV
ncbi:MAG: helix-turn-helix domain-containing protein, partial [Sarcina sp.]